MSKKYFAYQYLAKIQLCEVRKRNDGFYFDSFEEAKLHQVDCAKNYLDSAKQGLKIAEKRLAACLALKDKK
jgi:hypothetical protein